MAISTIAHVNTSIARTATERDFRTRIEALLDKADGEVLADLWQAVFPYPVDELPPHHAIVEDLADFVEVLQPRRTDMRTESLCRLIEKYIVTRRRQQSFVRRMISGVGDEGAEKVMFPRPRHVPAWNSIGKAHSVTKS